MFSDYIGGRLEEREQPICKSWFRGVHSGQRTLVVRHIPPE